jgi:hypothetical protein
MNPIGPQLETRVLSMVLTDLRATLATAQAVQAVQHDQPHPDVILDLSAAAQQLRQAG